MRVVFLMLLLVNAAFLAWVMYLRAPIGAQERIEQVQITPEKIRLVATPAAAVSVVAPMAPTAPEPDTAPPAKAAAKATACLQWGGFIGSEAARGDAAMAELDLPASQVRRVVSDQDGHWVVIPPMKSRAEVERMTERLKSYGVSDYSVVQEAPRRNAVSLGIFRTEEAAQNLLNGLRKRGVAEATIEIREGFFRRVMFYVREPDAAMVAKLSALKAANPGTDVKAVSCP